jgi:hypothetical protein
MEEIQPSTIRNAKRGPLRGPAHKPSVFLSFLRVLFVCAERETAAVKRRRQRQQTHHHHCHMEEEAATAASAARERESEIKKAIHARVPDFKKQAQ